MLVAKIQVSGTCAKTIYAIPITAGMIGGKVEILYTDPVWDGLKKTVVFQGSGTKDVETQDQIVTIPAKVIAQDRVHLKVGVFGVNAESVLAIPTLWAELGTVQPGADPSGDPSTDDTLPVWAQIESKIGDLDKLETTAKNNIVAAVNEALKKGGGSVDEAEIQRIVEEYLTANPPTVEETDPTVPAWAKQPKKPTYTAKEVGALPDTYTPPDQTAQQVGADPAGTAATAVSQHNTDTAAHNDLRIALQGLSDRVNAALDSDDATLDQMSEVVAYIKSNKSLIDAITTSKVSITDIVNDLITNASDKPLSAAQGVALKQLIDNLEIIAGDVDKKMDKPETAPEVGKILQVIAVNDDGTFTCAWVDAPIGGVSDVQLNGASVVTDGVAAIPLANGEKTYGMVKQQSSGYYCGIEIKNGSLTCSFQNQDKDEEWLVLRVRNKNYIIPFLAKGFDLMVKHAMCDTGTDTSGYAVPLIWSDAERISALLRMGCTVDDNGFVKWTAQ